MLVISTVSIVRTISDVSVRGVNKVIIKKKEKKKEKIRKVQDCTQLDTCQFEKVS